MFNCNYKKKRKYYILCFHLTWKNEQCHCWYQRSNHCRECRNHSWFRCQWCFGICQAHLCICFNHYCFPVMHVRAGFPSGKFQSCFLFVDDWNFNHNRVCVCACICKIWSSSTIFDNLHFVKHWNSNSIFLSCSTVAYHF